MARGLFYARERRTWEQNESYTVLFVERIQGNPSAEEILARGDLARLLLGEVDSKPLSRGERETVRQIVLYSFVLVAVTVTPFFWGTLGLAYLIAALSLGGGFIWLAEVTVLAALGYAGVTRFLFPAAAAFAVVGASGLVLLLRSLLHPVLGDNRPRALALPTPSNGRRTISATRSGRIQSVDRDR